MKKIAVVYSSKFGHTKQYADWLKEDTADLDVINMTDFNLSRMMTYKLVIFACGVYGDKLPIMDFIKKNLQTADPRKFMILAVSWYTNDSEEAAKKLIADNFPEQYKNTVPLFVVNSGIDKKQLSAGDKIKLKAAQMSIDKKKDIRSSDDINALAIIMGYSDQTSRDNLNSIKKAIAEFFDPKPKAAPSAPAEQPKPAAVTPPPVKTPPQPKPVSEMKTGDDALASLENAFNALKAPKQPAPQAAPVPSPQPAPEPNPKPEPDPRKDPVKAAVASSVKDAIAALSSGNMNMNYSPAPAFEHNEDAGTYSEAIAETVLKTAEKSQPAVTPAPVQKTEPVPTPAPKPTPVQKAESVTTPEPMPAPVQKAEPAPIPAPRSTPVQESEPAPTPEPKPTPVQKTEPAPTPAPAAKSEAASKLEQLVRQAVSKAPADTTAAPAAEIKPADSAPAPTPPPASAPRRNSYMELFAQRRRRAASEGSTAGAFSEPASEPIKSAEPIPEPVQTAAPVPEPVKPAAPEPAREVKPAAPAYTGTSSDAIIDFDFIMDEEPAVSEPPKTVGAADHIGMDVYDFISDGGSASSRALNAVKDLAKAKEEAEKEKKRAALGYTPESESEPETEPQTVADSGNNFLEKMKRDMETLAEESEHVLESKAEPVIEDEDIEGLEGFTFSNDMDYDLEAEFYAPEENREQQIAEKDMRTNFDLKKLQEEINVSIEQNKAAKERLEQRYGKKEKETPHNPFAVQFEEDESKGKKKRKAEAAAASAAPKRLADPIDPDIFFTRTSKKNIDSIPGEMPEIKFKNR